MCTIQNRDFTQRDEFSDVTLKVEGTSLFVHRQYLAEWSGVWRKLFLSECEDPSASIEIVLEDKTLEDVTQLLQCIYSSQNYITGTLIISAYLFKDCNALVYCIHMHNHDSHHKLYRLNKYVL
jgi:hypothetical protein